MESIRLRRFHLEGGHAVAEGARPFIDVVIIDCLVAEFSFDVGLRPLAPDDFFSDTVFRIFGFDVEIDGAAERRIQDGWGHVTDMVPWRRRRPLGAVAVAGPLQDFVQSASLGLGFPINKAILYNAVKQYFYMMWRDA